MKKALIIKEQNALEHNYVRMILDVLSNLRMPDSKCAKEMLGGPGSERVREMEEIGEKTGKQPKTFPTKQKHFLRATTRKVFIQLLTKSGLKSRRITKIRFLLLFSTRTNRCSS